MDEERGECRRCGEVRGEVCELVDYGVVVFQEDGPEGIPSLLVPNTGRGKEGTNQGNMLILVGSFNGSVPSS